MKSSDQERILTLLEQLRPLVREYMQPGAHREELRKLEAAIGLAIPQELRDWLQVCNGLLAHPGSLLGVPPVPTWQQISYAFEVAPEWRETGWLPVANDGCGNYYLLDTRQSTEGEHPVYFADHERDYIEPIYVVASGLWTFLGFFLQKALDSEKEKPYLATLGKREAYEYIGKREPYWWPFNKERVLEVDPKLAGFRGIVPLPWDADT
jgi:cell wall assembly regulator SMI1